MSALAEGQPFLIMSALSPFVIKLVIPLSIDILLLLLTTCFSFVFTVNKTVHYVEEDWWKSLLSGSIELKWES